MKKLTWIAMFILIFLLNGCNLVENQDEIVITFDSNGGSEVQSIKTDGITVISLPNNPIKEGYVFDGWYLDNINFTIELTETSFVNDPISSNITVYAKWNLIETGIDDQLKVTLPGFTLDVFMLTKTEPLRNNIEYFDFMESNIVIDSKSRYVVSKNLLLTEVFSSKVVTLDEGNNVYYLAVYAENDSERRIYTVNIYRNMLTSVSYFKNDIDQSVFMIQNQVEENQMIVEPVSTPIIEGYNFEAWYKDNSLTERWDFDTDLATVDLELYAKYTPKTVTLQFDANGGEGDMETVLLLTGQSIPKVIFSKENYYFVGWSLTYDGMIVHQDEELFIVQHDADTIIFYAMWEEVPYTRDIDYVYFGWHPQTIIDDEVTVGNVQDENGLYLGSDGEKYFLRRAAYHYDNYFSNGKKIISNALYYFKVEPIKWRILSETDGIATLITDQVIMRSEYIEQGRIVGSGDSYSIRYSSDRYYSPANRWAGSLVQRWLNSTFINTYFTEKQREIMLVNENIPTGSPSENASLSNYAFLLTINDVNNVDFGFSDDLSRVATASDWVIASTSGYRYDSRWMLRSPGNADNKVAYVNETGFIVSNGFIIGQPGYNISNMFDLLRPAMIIDLNKIP